MNNFVSVVDDNIINQNALKILITSYLKIYNNTSNYFIVSTREFISPSYASWLIGQGIKVDYFKWERKDDPYAIKFLLSEFALKNIDFIEDFIYLDPDHIFFNLINLGKVEKSFILSSEYSTNSDDEIHFNTSFIFGNAIDWINIKEIWFSEYQKLFNNGVAIRYLEEISFANAVKKIGLNIHICDKSIQSNYRFCADNFSLFHYGGESKYTKELKKCLETDRESQIKENLTRITLNAKSSIQKLLAKKMLSYL
jgi:Leucine-rich repeat (LRR) protein